MATRTVTTVRRDRETLARLDGLAPALPTGRSSLLRRAGDRKARSVLRDEALSKYIQGELSAGAAKEWAGVSYARFLDELRVRGLPFLTDEEEMQRELEELKAKVVRRARRHR